MGQKILKKVIALFCCLSILFCCTHTTQAAAKTLSVTRVTQAKDSWCWAAASEMVGKYGTPSNKTQWDVVNLIWGPTYPNLSGNIDNMVSGVQYASDYSKAAKSSSTLLALGTVQSKINSGKPMIARLRWTSASGHAIVFAGYNNSKIKCIDPWKNTSTNYYLYTDLRDGGNFATGKGKVSHTIYY